jgi:spore photoproduct lyase
MQIIKNKTKTLTTRDNGRSSDAISPNFIYGCLGGCMKSYCYVGRFNNDRVYINENTDQIISSISKWVEKQPWPKTPNQCDEKYYVIDIGCSTDVALHSKHYDWQKVFDFFNNHPKLKFTFATKYPSKFKPEEYTIDPKNRIRVSLMPQNYSSILEPGTDDMFKRIEQLSRLFQFMEVHINFSPIIYDPIWLQQYKWLFDDIKFMYKEPFQSECIFLTYNDVQHQRNTEEVNELCWKPKIQEKKDSQYAVDNIRYQWQLKARMINEFKELYSQYWPVETIRYIF